LIKSNKTKYLPEANTDDFVVRWGKICPSRRGGERAGDAGEIFVSLKLGFFENDRRSSE